MKQWMMTSHFQPHTIWCCPGVGGQLKCFFLTEMCVGQEPARWTVSSLGWGPPFGTRICVGTWLEGITKCLEDLIAVGYEWLLTGVEFLDAVHGYSRPCCFGRLFDSCRAVMRFLTHQKITEIPKFCNVYLENLSSRPTPQHSL